jgi:hypothetical protein
MATWGPLKNKTSLATWDDNDIYIMIHLDYMDMYENMNTYMRMFTTSTWKYDICTLLKASIFVPLKL